MDGKRGKGFETWCESHDKITIRNPLMKIDRQIQKDRQIEKDRKREKWLETWCDSHDKLLQVFHFA